MKQCTKCNQRLDKSNFTVDLYKKSGLSSWCKKCRRIWARTKIGSEAKRLQQKKYRQTEKGKLTRKICQKVWEQSEKGKESKRIMAKRMREKYPLKSWSRKELQLAILRGDIIKRNSCEICYNGHIQCHHEDYSKPLEFIELCTKCHVVLHKQYKEQNILIT